MDRETCPICDCKEFSKPRQDLGSHPYVQCGNDNCKFYYQQNLISKVYEADHERAGDVAMDDHSKVVNRSLAQWLVKYYEDNQ